MRLPPIHRLGLVVGLVLVSAVLIAPVPFRLTPQTEMTPEQAKTVLHLVRRGFIEERPVRLDGTLAPLAGDSIPIVVTAWVGGRRVRVWQVDDRPLSDAVPFIVTALRGARDAIDHPTLRIQLDFVVSTGWIPQSGLWASLAFVEGHDGVSGLSGDRRIFLPPYELIRRNRYGSFRPLPGYDRRFTVGIDPNRVKSVIKHQGSQLGLHTDDVGELQRFRALSVVEGHDLTPRRLLKGTVERPGPTRDRVRASVLAGARYLNRALRPDGLFRYYYNPVMDRKVKGAYNWPRHAGVSYSLALVGRVLERREFVDAAGRALQRFSQELTPGPDGSRCLMAKGKCYLGSSALGLLALSEYRIASGDDRFDGLAAAIADFLVFMQKEDGLFFHDWYVNQGIDRESMKLYASQQALLALARHARAVNDERALNPAVKGMDTLAGPYWDHFLSGYFFGQEHWTCLAAEEIYSARPKPQYAELCHDIGHHYDNITLRETETPFAEDVGGMSITHLITPHICGTATAAEAMVSAVLLGNEIGRDTTSIRRQLQATFGFLIKGQVTVHDLYWIRHPLFAVGGFFDTQTKPKIRIDTVQHAISAMVRGMHLLPKDNVDSLAEAMRDYAVSF